MGVGIFAPVPAATAGLVRQALADLGTDVHLFDIGWRDPPMVDGGPSPSDRGATWLGEDEAVWGGVDLTRLGAAYVHGHAYENPVLPAADPEADWALWQCGHLLRQQQHSYVHSLLSRLEETGVSVVNGARAHVLAFTKPAQLDAVAGGGVDVAPRLQTNEAEAVEAFLRRHTGTVVWRTVTGRCAWQRFGPRQKEHLIAPTKPPVLLAAVRNGPFLRAYVCGGRVALVLEQRLPNCDSLEVLEGYRATPPLPEEHASLIGTAIAAGVAWGAIHYVRSPDGPVVYDVDPDPVLADLPVAVARFLAQALALSLSGRAAEIDTLPPPTEPHERRSLFLRRMLRMQFQLEASKYE